MDEVKHKKNIIILESCVEQRPLFDFIQKNQNPFLNSTQPRKNNNNKCPLCQKQLYKKYLGLVCKNWKCQLYYKCNSGWIKVESSENQFEKFNLKNLFSMNLKENQLKWIILKKTIIERDNYACTICGISAIIANKAIQLNVHHLIPRMESPELTFDEDNLITVCKQCHYNLHSKDKYAFRKGNKK